MHDEDVSFYISPFMGLVPILVFIVGAVYLGVMGAPDASGFWPIVLGGLLVGVALSRNVSAYAKAVIQGMADRTVAIMVAAWLLAGALGHIVSQTGVIDQLVAGYSLLGLGSTTFIVGSFVLSSIVATTTGTAVGTVLLVTPVLVPAGISVGAQPILLLGAILGGGAFGDDYSPISDTTIASARTQNVPIQISVQSRLKYVFLAACIAIIGYVILSGSGVLAGSGVSEVSTTLSMSQPSLLVILLGPLLVVGLCYARVHLLVALLYGIAVTLGLALLTGAIGWSTLFQLNLSQFRAESIIIEGMDTGIGISVFSIFLIGLIRGSIAGGLLRTIIDSKPVQGVLNRSPEFGISAVTMVANFLTAHNTITILSVGDAVDQIGEDHDVSAVRRCNIMDLTANTVMHIAPYMITVILVASSASESGLQSVDAWKAGLLNLHSWALLVVIGFSIWTGYGRARGALSFVS